MKKPLFLFSVFYLAGYIETWGRGIQKICDSCKALGADIPHYELRGNGIRVHFPALQNALIENSKAPKVQAEPLNEPLDNKLPLINQKILEQISNNPRITYNELAIFLNVSRSSVKRAMNKLTNAGLIERVGGRRYGHWRIIK